MQFRNLAKINNLSSRDISNQFPTKIKDIKSEIEQGLVPSEEINWKDVEKLSKADLDAWAETELNIKLHQSHTKANMLLDLKAQLAAL